MLKTFVLSCSVALLGTVGTASAQDWTKSKWGPNDEVGAANYMTPDIVMKAAGLIKTGKTYGLGIETNSKTPAFPPRTFKVLVLQPGQAGGSGLGPNQTTFRSDQDRQDLWSRHRNQFKNAGLPAPHLQGAGAAARTSRRQWPRPEQDHLPI